MTAASPRSPAGLAPSPQRPVPASPSVHMRVLITWLAVYPSITVLQLLLGSSVDGLPVAVRLLVITAVVVPVVVYVLVPGLLKIRAGLLRLGRH
jgi:antibiotic biosynthesis monooxygenase (ABM) superfamily enzyme